MAFFLSFLLLATACTQYDSEEIEQPIEQSIDYSLYQEYMSSNVYVSTASIEVTTDGTRAPSNPWAAYINEVNESLGSDFSLPEEATNLIYAEADEIYNTGLENGWMDRGDVKLAKTFTSDNEKYGFDTAISNYETNLINSRPTEAALVKHGNIINVLKVSNEENPDLFKYGGDRSGDRWGCDWCKCAAASVALFSATMSLATCVTVFACGLALVLVYAASNSFASACLE